MSASVAPGKGSLGWWLALALVVAAVGGRLLWSRFQGQEAPEEKFVAERFILPQEPTIEVPVRSVAEVMDQLGSDDLVLGVTIGRQSRAYPLGQLNAVVSRKILNDTLDGRPIAVTWCDSCHNGIVFLREVDGEPLTFGVFGSLWKRSMTMRDEETGSVWSHFDGQARLGPHKGARLTVVPSIVTDWATWRELHPGGEVAWFAEERDQAMTRALYHDMSRFVLGIASGRQAKVWPLAELSEQGVINDTWSGKPVVAAMGGRRGRVARLFSREVGGRVLTFESRDGVLTDRETGTSWDAATGEAIEGELAGRALTPLPAMVSLREAWGRFYPSRR